MRNAVVCWGPECGQVVTQPKTGRPGRYHSPTCKQRAVRRNGGTAPTEPYPPLEPTPLQQDATPATVKAGSEQQARKATGPHGLDPGGLGSSDAAGKARKERRDSVPPPVVATTGTAPAPVQPPPEATPPAPARNPERAGATPFTEQRSSDTGAAAEQVASLRGSGEATAQVVQMHLAVTENSTVPVEIKVHPMVAAYKADVAKLGKAGSRQGLQVIEMAEKLVSSATSPAAAANLSKELHRLMDALEESSNDALVSQDPSLIIRDRTLEKLRQIQAAGVDEASA